MFRRLLPFAIFSLLTFLTFNAAAETIVGTVVGISDGDTLTLLTNDKRQAKVRLGEIDTPESGQPYGAQAKKELSDLAFGRQAAVDVQDTDRYGRTVGRVRVDNLDINSELVRRGAAWVYRQYLRDRSLLEIEAGARARRAGLWALPEAQQTPPWEWRTAKRVGDPANAASGAAIAPTIEAEHVDLRGEAHLRPNGELRGSAILLEPVWCPPARWGWGRGSLRKDVPLNPVQFEKHGF